MQVVCCISLGLLSLMSSATAIVRSGGLIWLKPVAIVLFMWCSAVLVELLHLKPCCVEMYGSSVFSSVLISLREVRWVCMMCLFSCLC